ncbi:hypothetical protein B0H10DRAFT_2217265 [Mycena sp. CBHHK59/15]|nr:hypothetical protein B0H10DRAFT_2217265 [Mycena sp. CBHHK59/15]
MHALRAQMFSASEHLRRPLESVYPERVSPSLRRRILTVVTPLRTPALRLSTRHGGSPLDAGGKGPAAHINSLHDINTNRTSTSHVPVSASKDRVANPRRSPPAGRAVDAEAQGDGPREAHPPPDRQACATSTGASIDTISASHTARQDASPLPPADVHPGMRYGLRIDVRLRVPLPVPPARQLRLSRVSCATRLRLPQAPKRLRTPIRKRTHVRLHHLPLPICVLLHKPVGPNHKETQ